LQDIAVCRLASFLSVFGGISGGASKPRKKHQHGGSYVEKLKNGGLIRYQRFITTHMNAEQNM